MPKNDLDLDYLPIDPATVQPGEPVASSGGILSYVENPEGFFQMLKKQVSALQYRADISYDLGDSVWDGDTVNPRLLASRTNLNVGNALPISPSLVNANWIVTDLDIGTTSHIKVIHGGLQVLAGGASIFDGLNLNSSSLTGATTINASGRITSGGGVTVGGTLTGATTGAFSGSVTAAAGGTNAHLARRDTYATTTLGGTLKARLAGANLFLTNNGVNP
jgi:hypothetical protein